MMAVRTAATQLGYVLGATVGGVLIAGTGYAMLGFVLAAGMAVSALLVLRVDDPLERRAGPTPPRLGLAPRSGPRTRRGRSSNTRRHSVPSRTRSSVGSP